MRCAVCKKEKEADAFHKYNKRKSGYQAKCKECTKVYSRERHRRNPQRRIEQNREYRRSGGTTHFFASLLLHGAKKRSLQKQRLCTLTPEDILDLLETQKNQCAYLGTEMVWRPKAGIFQVSLDRIDSSHGYVVSNCQLVCDGINQLKNDMKENDFVYLLKLLARPAPDSSPPLVLYSDFTSAQKNKFSQLFGNMKKGRRKAKRNVTREELHSLRAKQQDRCALTGIRVTWECNQWSTASWDRIDSEGDYEVDNMQLTIWPINRMKKNHSNKDAIEMISRIREVYGESAYDL